MICVRLEGGLGNQLFQYAAGRHLSLIHNTGLLLDLSALTRSTRGITPRGFELDRFHIQARVNSNQEGKELAIARRLGVFSPLITGWRTCKESGIAYNSGFEGLPDRTFLVGYWQSFHYFQKVASVICRELRPTQSLSDASKQTLAAVENTNAVAVHVRRGDYVLLKSAAKFHGALPLSYYIRCLSRIREVVKNPHFFVFSDDPIWCAEHLPLHPEEATFVNHNPNDAAWQDLALMVACHHHIIANSSFSWWGAWLADQQLVCDERLVFAPAQWFKGQPLSSKDRFPAHWTAVD